MASFQKVVALCIGKVTQQIGPCFKKSQPYVKKKKSASPVLLEYTFPKSYDNGSEKRMEGFFPLYKKQKGKT